MGYLALYRKYRPKSLLEMIGQENVIDVITNEIKNNKISHAYLFTGPRGTGKTSLAKIIAKTVNCTNLKEGIPCGECYNCKNFDTNSDIIEIDAASNNGIEEIREIREKISLVPTNSKYKVYIIDEVHMLTTQAFNALLKTLEEPPAHVIFIFATTEFYKIPSTILSRCQKFQFNKIDDELIVKRLQQISLAENIIIDDSALYEIARLSDGGLRDSINYLDQLASLNKENITIDDVFDVNCSVSYDMIYKLLKYIIDQDYLNVIEFLEFINQNGKNINKFVEELLIFVKDLLIYKNTKKLTKIKNKNEKIQLISNDFDTKLIYIFIDEINNLIGKIKNSDYPTILLTTSLLKMIDLNKKIEGDKIKRQNTNREIVEEYSNLKKESDNEIKKNKYSNRPLDVGNFKKIRVNNTFVNANKELLNKFREKWKEIYLIDDDELVKYIGLLMDCYPAAVSADYAIVVSKYEATSQRINEELTLIEMIIKKVYASPYKIIALSEKEWSDAKVEYINNRKKGFVYNLENEPKMEESNSSSDELPEVKKLIQIVGEDIIEYK